jgi:hypothetical protein
MSKSGKKDGAKISRFTVIGFTRRGQTIQRHNTVCVGHHYAQTNTNKINKICFLLRTTGDKDEHNNVNTTPPKLLIGFL